MPAPSWPSTAGSISGIVPFCTETSEWQTPLETTLTCTSFGPSPVTPTSPRTSRSLPSSQRIAAFMTRFSFDRDERGAIATRSSGGGKGKEADESRPTRSEAKPSEGRQPERERVASAKVRQGKARRIAKILDRLYPDAAIPLS